MYYIIALEKKSKSNSCSNLLDFALYIVDMRKRKCALCKIALYENPPNPLSTVIFRIGQTQSWALPVFLNFFNNKKRFFVIFYQVDLTGSGLFK